MYRRICLPGLPRIISNCCHPLATLILVTVKRCCTTADAVYIGGPSFGARNKAENTVADIAGLVEFAHRYGARIFATVNTILHDSELEGARLIHQLYNRRRRAIVRDMGNRQARHSADRTARFDAVRHTHSGQAKFLGEVGFSQLVLARELTIPQIREMRAAVNPGVPLEYFIHGALCVAFSGNCYISEAHTGRSANRGGCSQECRLPYTLEGMPRAAWWRLTSTCCQ